MKIEQNISLKPYNTFGIDVNAKSYCNISSIDELTQCLEKYKEEKLFILCEENTVYGLFSISKC